MKLRSSLPQAPGFLYAIPLVNLFALLLLFYVVSPYFIQKKGVSVQLPSSIFDLASIPDAAVITMSAGNGSDLYLNQIPFTLTDLERELEKMKMAETPSSQSLVIMADRLVDSASLRNVAELCARKGFKVVLAAEPNQPTAPPNEAIKPDP